MPDASTNLPIQTSPGLAHARPELLAPAGNWDCARAAVANGANAIYFGLDCGFNARARATNFGIADLPELLEFLHQHAVSGFVTVNTLAFSDELPAVERVIESLAEHGVDAVLVQDLGLVRLIREIAPDLPVHASTQMTMTSAENIAQLHALDIQRVVLARELSIDEIARIHAATEMPLEAFVHGALCVSYSGQCLTSESLGGRSANRGQCAQACRLPYELICDGEDIPLDDQPYLLSPQDLAAYDLVPQLIQAGVISLKIEGRLKTPEYVANITRHYRRAIDAAVQQLPSPISQRDVESMELSFSRGFSHGWLDGCDHKQLVPGKTSAKQGVAIGEVVRVRADRVEVRLHGRIKAGDGIVFEGDRVAGEEQGGRVFALRQRGRSVTGVLSQGVVEVTFPRGSVNFGLIQPGALVRKNDDPVLTKQLRKTFEGRIAAEKEPVSFHVVARTGHPLKVIASLAGGAQWTFHSDAPLAAANRHVIDESTLKKQLGRLGETDFQLAALEAEIVGGPMVPLSVLGAIRRELVQCLQQHAETIARDHHRWPTVPGGLVRLRQQVASNVQRSLGNREDSPQSPRSDQNSLHLLVRSLDQLRAAVELPVDRLLLDFQDIREYREGVALAQQANRCVYLATPRIQKPGEIGIFQLIRKLKPDGVLVRNLAGLDFFHRNSMACMADFSLNTANELTFEWLMSRGAEMVTAAYDLNRDQLLELARYVNSPAMEVVIHQHMPMFHMEHCVFCAVLSPGTNKTNCGRPCDRHEVKLRDRTGTEHPLTADVGCRNTLFNATPQSGAEAVPELLSLGVRRFRIETVPETSPDLIRQTFHLYRSLLRGETSAAAVWKALRASNRVGVTRGTMEERRNPLAII